mgnify:FL=1
MLRKLLFIIIYLYSSVCAVANPHMFIIQNFLRDEIVLSPTNCPLLFDSIDMIVYAGNRAYIAIPPHDLDDCLLKFYRNNIPIFSVYIVGETPILYNCKNRHISSQPGYRCELTKSSEEDYSVLTLHAT